MLKIDIEKMFVREANSDRNTDTLSYRLGDMLIKAEKMFGARDYSYTVLGVEFSCEGPCIWYSENRRFITILISSDVDSYSRVLYQLAHETVHLLAPTGGSNATNLEEGVACYFASHYMKEAVKEERWKPADPRYRHALKIVSPLLDSDLGCIRRLRERQPSFTKMSVDDIRSEFPKISDADTHFLVRKFDTPQIL